MSALVIVTGSPGAGKTVLCASMAKAARRGVHVESDVFYDFVADRIPPTLPEAHEQNSSIILAALQAAQSFASNGYEVFLDGIFGPWFIPLITKELDSGLDVSYLILRVDLLTALSRVAARKTGDAPVVRQMHAAFENIGSYEQHVLDVNGLSPSQVVDRIRRLDTRGFRLTPSED